jgi:hypothetical protein
VAPPWPEAPQHGAAEPQRQIPDSKFKIQESKFKIQNSRFKILDPSLQKRLQEKPVRDYRGLSGGSLNR